jgi:DNA modification methylase
MPANPDKDAPSFQWGPTNPHPLSKMHTELVWEGKYDEFGRRREVDVAALSMPMQRIETVDEPRQRAAATGNLELFEKQLAGKKRDDFRNRLIWGDNKLVMASLLKEFKGKVDLFYIDPPFDVGADFTMDVPIGDNKETIFKDQSCLEMVAFKYMWGKDTNSYLHMMFERLSLIKDLLRDTGSIFVHCDWRVNYMLHGMLNEIFSGNLRNEIIWCYTGPGSPGMSQYSRKHDNIYWYSVKATGFKFRDAQIRVPHDEKTQANFKAGLRGSGFIGDNYDLPEGKIPEDWWEMAIAARYPVDGIIRTGYATEKPWPLIERIINTCTDEGDLVADVFCGGGTTGAVAERMGRRWIMADLGRFAIHTSRKRMIELQRKLHNEGKSYRAFDVHNLGRYERQWWQKDRLKGAEAEHRRVVLEFFKAEVLTGAPSPLLHGRKGGAFCHVDGLDSIFTREEASAVAKAVAQAGGREVFCLAWEFEMELRQHCLALEAELGVKMKLIPIPREIMEKNRTSPPPFLEMALLEAGTVIKKAKGKTVVDVKLTKFLPSLAEVPSKELEELKERAVKSGFDFIDFWAVDFDWHPNQPFHHDWQDYRTRKDRSLKTVSDAGHVYDKSGKHTICVKVVDVFGCDTSITLDVEV